MLLAEWIDRLTGMVYWPVVLVVLLGLGIVIGAGYVRYRRVFFVFCTFWVSLTVSTLIFSGYFPAEWTIQLFSRLQASPDTLRFWMFVLLSVGVVFLTMPIRRGEVFGRFFAGFFLFFNGFFLVIWMSEWVEIIRFLRTISFQTALWISVLVALGGVFVRGIPAVVAACTGSSLLILAYLQILQRLGERDTFFGQPPFVLFVFLILAVLMRAVQGEWGKE